MESVLLCIQTVLFSEHFSYLNTPWSQHVWISDFPLYYREQTSHFHSKWDQLSVPCWYSLCGFVSCGALQLLHWYWGFEVGLPIKFWNGLTLAHKTPSVFYFVHYGYKSAIWTWKQFGFAWLFPHQCCTSWDFDLGINSKHNRKWNYCTCVNRFQFFFLQITNLKTSVINRHNTGDWNYLLVPIFFSGLNSDLEFCLHPPLSEPEYQKVHCFCFFLATSTRVSHLQCVSLTLHSVGECMADSVETS